MIATRSSGHVYEIFGIIRGKVTDQINRSVTKEVRYQIMHEVFSAGWILNPVMVLIEEQLSELEATSWDRDDEA